MTMTKDEVVLRLATSEDAAACVRFDYHPDEARMRRWCEDGTIFVAELDGRLVGYLRLEFLWGHLPYIALIRLDEDRRGRGLGTRLLGFVEDHLRVLGKTMLLSSSQVDEPRPQAWHRKVGFVEIGALGGVNPGGVGEVFFRKDL